MIPQTLWKSRIDGSPPTHMTAAGELVLVVTQEAGPSAGPATMTALNLTDGQERWQKRFDQLIISGVVAAEPGGPVSFIVTASSRDIFLEEGSVWGFDYRGEPVWQWRGKVQTVAAPTLQNGRLLLVADSEMFVELDAVSGREVSRSPLRSPSSYNAPAAEKNRVFIPGNGPHLLAINRSGGERWRYQGDGSGWLDQTPSPAGELLVAVSSKGEVITFNQEDGSVVWQTTAGRSGRPLTAPVVDPQRLYVGTRDGVYAFNLSDGQEAWSFATERAIEGRPMIVGEQLLVTGHDHFVYALHLESGQAEWRHEMNRRIELPPVLAVTPKGGHDMVVVIDRGGNAIAFDLQTDAPQEAARTPDPFDDKYLAETAEELESKGEITGAAEAWYAAGNLERAAEQYEMAGRWQRAAQLWREAGRFLKHAQALQGYAQSIDDEAGGLGERAQAWAAATVAYEGEGEHAKADYCRRQVAKYEKQPLLDLTVEHAGLVLNVWSTLNLTVFNTGYGPARRIEIDASGEQFDGEIASTKYMFKLAPDESLGVVLTVRPLQYGQSVPLRIALNYVDNKQENRRLEKTIFVPVTEAQATRIVGQIQNVFAGHGPNPGSTKGPVGADDVDLVDLRRTLAVYFSMHELRELCFDLAIDAEELISERKSIFAREIILYMQRRQALPDLLAYCRETRPHLEW